MVRLQSGISGSARYLTSGIWPRQTFGVQCPYQSSELPSEEAFPYAGELAQLLALPCC